MSVLKPCIGSTNGRRFTAAVSATPTAAAGEPKMSVAAGLASRVVPRRSSIEVVPGPNGSMSPAKGSKAEVEVEGRVEAERVGAAAAAGATWLSKENSSCITAGCAVCTGIFQGVCWTDGALSKKSSRLGSSFREGAVVFCAAVAAVLLL